LITDLCCYMGRVYYLFYHLSPSYLLLKDEFENIRFNDSEKNSKEKAGGEISKICNYAQIERRGDINKFVDPEFIKISMKEIGDAISNVLDLGNEEIEINSSHAFLGKWSKSDFDTSWHNWKWSEMLELLRDISILITYDFP